MLKYRHRLTCEMDAWNAYELFSKMLYYISVVGSAGILEIWNDRIRPQK